jgi:hypothetical protein
MDEQSTSENPTPEGNLADEAMALSIRIGAILTGKGSAVQSAALADLTSRWLSGHLSKSRKELFASWTELVWKLLPANVKLTERASNRTRMRPAFHRGNRGSALPLRRGRRHGQALRQALSRRARAARGRHLKAH